jgi:hypothetical protein
VFTGEIATTPLALSKNVINKNYISSSEGDSIDYDVESSERVRVKTYDFFKLLSYTYNSFNSTTDNNYFMGESNIFRNGMSDKIGAYRYANSVAASQTFNDAMKYVTNPANFNIAGLKDFLYQNEQGCHNEILAYRIEKVGGKPTGDARNQNVLPLLKHGMVLNFMTQKQERGPNNYIKMKTQTVEHSPILIHWEH